jgi:nucleoid-associated protein YgaU
MGFFDKKPEPNFSDVKGGSGSKGNAPLGTSPTTGGTADFSDVSSGSSSTSVGGGSTYIVKSGDSLSKIAKRVYGDASEWKKIHAANSAKIPNPDLIHPGLELTIPDA